jgi:hypothetical protein
MSDVNVITPPDKLFDHATKIFLIHPGVETRKNISSILEGVHKPINIYLYEEPTGMHMEWVLDVCNDCTYCILDLDNSGEMIRKFASILIAKPNTFYLTNDEVTPYNLISANRIFDLHWLDRLLKED